MKRQSVDSDQLDVVGGTNCGGATEFLLIQQDKAGAMIQTIRLGRLVFCQDCFIDRLRQQHFWMIRTNELRHAAVPNVDACIEVIRQS